MNKTSEDNTPIIIPHKTTGSVICCVWTNYVPITIILPLIVTKTSDNPQLTSLVE